jgi:hypothetical protein
MGTHIAARSDPARRTGVSGPYLSNGLYDAYGNFEGTQRLAVAARHHGIQTQWHPTYGGHCATDVASLAAFLES